MYICGYLRTYVCTYVSLHTQTHIHINICFHIYIYIIIYTYTYKYIYTYMHACIAAYQKGMLWCRFLQPRSHRFPRPHGVLEAKLLRATRRQASGGVRTHFRQKMKRVHYKCTCIHIRIDVHRQVDRQLDGWIGRKAGR